MQMAVANVGCTHITALLSTGESYKVRTKHHALLTYAARSWWSAGAIGRLDPPDFGAAWTGL